MKTFFGLLLIIVGVCLGVYVGVWWCFIGGIIAIIEACKSDPINSFDIATGIARIMFAGICGLISGFVCIAPGAALVTYRENKRRF